MAKILNALEPCNTNIITMQNTAVEMTSNDGFVSLLPALRAPLARVTMRCVQANAHKIGKLDLNPRYCASLVSWRERTISLIYNHIPSYAPLHVRKAILPLICVCKTGSLGASLSQAGLIISLGVNISGRTHTPT